MKDVNRKIVLLLLGLIISATWSFSVIYAETDAPSLSVGDTWTYGLRNQVTGEIVQPYTVTIDSMEDYDGIPCYVWTTSYPESTLQEWITTEEGDWTILKLNHNIYEGDQIVLLTYSPGMKLYDFPLSVGKEWSGESNVTFNVTDSSGEPLGGNSYTVSWHRKVVSVDSVTVPAGTFDTYLVEEVTADDGIENHERKYYYFCYNVNSYAKYDRYDPNVNQLYSYGDLTSYDVAVQGEGDGQVDEQGDDFSFMLLPVGLAVVIVVLVLTVFLYYRRRQASRETKPKPTTDT